MIDLITVVFSDEISYLKTQAKSISLYVPEINNIYVIVNDTDDVCNQIDTNWWVQHKNAVQVIPYSKWKYTSTMIGWDNQQLLKLLAASEAISKWSMALDAKTWFVNNLDYTKLFDSTGRPNVGWMPTKQIFQPAKQFVEQHYNITMNNILGPAGVPFIFHTEDVVDMINGFNDFICFFQTNVKSPNFLTEFYLYSAYILSKYQSYENLYNKRQHYGCCNIADFDVPQFDLHLNNMKNPLVLTASIHRRAYPLLSTHQLQTWIDFLSSKQIVPEFLLDLTK